MLSLPLVPEWAVVWFWWIVHVDLDDLASRSLEALLGVGFQVCHHVDIGQRLDLRVGLKFILVEVVLESIQELDGEFGDVVIGVLPGPSALPCLLTSRWWMFGPPR